MASPVGHLSDRRVRVEVGVEPQKGQGAAFVALCLVVVVPPGVGRLAWHFPRAVVRRTRFAQRSEGSVEHLRFTAVQDFGRLPGLDPLLPSRLRDSVVLALTAGAEAVDILAVHLSGLAPWNLDDERIMGLLDPFLEEMPGAMIVLPDLGGPLSTGPEPMAPLDERRSTLERTLKRFAEGLRERYQVALFDLPPDERTPDDDLFPRLAGVDAAACCWTGTPIRLRAHGWRSAAVASAAMLAADPLDVFGAMAGRTVTLGPGRRARRDKGMLLGRAPLYEDRRPDRSEYAIQLRIEGRQDVAHVVSEGTLRRPIGAWRMPALRTAKALHRSIVRAADPFVFRPLQEAEAFKLVIALSQIIRPFADEGIIVGPGGAGAPEIDAQVDRNPATPGFVADVTAQLRPWARNVRIRVRVQPGQKPALEGI